MSSRSPEVAVEVGGGKESRPCSLPDAVDVGAGVEDLGPCRPKAPAGDWDLLRDLERFLEPEAEAGVEDLG